MESLLQSLPSARDAVLSEVAGKPVAIGYGAFAAEAEAVAQGAGIMDWSAGGVIGVRGADAAMFLNGVTTNNVKALAKGRAQDNLLCANKGKILHAVLILRSKEDEFLVVTDPGETDAVARHLDNYHVREDLVMGVAGLARLEVVGPRAAAALEHAGLALPAPGQFAPNTHGGAPVLTLNIPLGQTPRFTLLVPPPAAPGLVQTLLGADGARLVGLNAWEEARIWARVPRFQEDFGTDHLPAEAGLYTHIAFDKGCYVGQETHARMHYRGHPNRKLVAFTLPEGAAEGEAGAVQIGTQLFQGEDLAGQVTSISRASRAGQRAGLAMVRFPLAAAQTPLSLAPSAAPLLALAPVATDLGTPRG